MSEETISDSQSSLKAVALRVVDLPLSLYNSFSQGKLSPGIKKLIVVTAFSAVSVIFLARHFKRRRGKKKQSPWDQELFVPEFTRTAASEKGSSCSSSRQNLSLSLTSVKEKGSQSYNVCANGGLFSKLSGSAQSLGSVKSVNSSQSCAYANSNSWDKVEDNDLKLVNIPVTTPENLYLMGMELFEEALRRWEQALTFRSKQAEDEVSCSSIKLGAGDAIAEENIEDIISADFIHKLEGLLQRAYRLQEEFEASLGASDPTSLANDIDKNTDITVKEDADDFCLRDTLSIASTDSFVSAAELYEQHKELRNTYALGSFCHCPLYEEAMHLAEEGKIYCRVLRTDMLECLGDSDFLAKLHCVRQAFQVILLEAVNRKFLAETGKNFLSSLIVKAQKNPKRFEAVFDEMMLFLEQTDHWDDIQIELSSRGVKNLNFYDIVLDFILMDSFEDLENPPTSIQNVVNNRWLNSSFKETAVASSCWSVLKQKRRQMKVPDGFIAHFYAICEHISPVLAWGFLGPKQSLYDLCCFFKDQVLFFLKDIFDFEKVRYASVESLAEDIMQLLHRRTELLTAYLGADSLWHTNGCINTTGHAVPTGHLEAKVQ
ncbi:mitoguardin 1 isoform X1 [Latimeria chalumnae]|uniref:Mitoguardin 1 n=1 Tax=Latimeria chalumnae TaxID=7897 RepID=M3XHJ2_LATCH|nr:PREDICTED: protein FAM73A isoform X1 [Latimeria chalumnae]XP_005998987.1 PREDICTED: protein FAM73A isoform X1 [Latimeria chalumnae]|eukprot:XP_005998986.1 PREDICTED: protein FAM73A isoform X1 [Latimeria chalumnae]